MTERRFARPSWQEINSTNGWTLTNVQSYSAAGGEYHRAAFRYDPESELVTLRGLLQVVTSTPPSLTIPVWLRPYADEIFATGTDAGGTQQFARMDVNAAGTINWSGPAIAVGNYLTISGVSWYLGRS